MVGTLVVAIVDVVARLNVRHGGKNGAAARRPHLRCNLHRRIFTVATGRVAHRVGGRIGHLRPGVAVGYHLVVLVGVNGVFVGLREVLYHTAADVLHQVQLHILGQRAVVGGIGHGDVVDYGGVGLAVGHLHTVGVEGVGHSVAQRGEVGCGNALVHLQVGVRRSARRLQGRAVAVLPAVGVGVEAALGAHHHLVAAGGAGGAGQGGIGEGVAGVDAAAGNQQRGRLGGVLELERGAAAQEHTLVVHTVFIEDKVAVVREEVLVGLGLH